MSEERVVKRLYQSTTEGSRTVGRPGLRWLDDVREDLRRMGVTNWRILAHRRDDWKMVVKDLKSFYHSSVPLVSPCFSFLRNLHHQQL